MARFKIQSKRSKWVIYPTATLAWINFFAFIVCDEHFGGDALNGYMRAGHYYLNSHGRYTEVTQAIWNYSYWHAISAMGGIFLVFVELAVFINIGDIVLESRNRT